LLAWPATVGKMFDTNGSYRAAPWIMAACRVFGAAATMTLPPFAKRE
jgi:hypothetical protein